MWRYLCFNFNYSKAIYIPNDIAPWCDACGYILEGFNLENIESYFVTFAPPSETIETMMETTYVSSIKCLRAKGYFIENF